MEALEKITKRCLKAVVKDRLFHKDVLHTRFPEIKSMVNSRLLTTVSDDIDHLEPLTQNHFLTG